MVSVIDSTTISFLSFIVSCVALAISLSTFFVSYFNFRRDRANLRIIVNIGWRVHGDGPYDNNKDYVHIKVFNIGRRPEYINFVCLVFPDGSNGIVVDGYLNQKKVAEGEPPADFLAEQEAMGHLKKSWPGILAIVRTSSGRQYRSSFIDIQPSGCDSAHFGQRLKQRLHTRFKHRWAFKTHHYG